MMARFKAGRLVGTAEALEALEDAGTMPLELLARHVSGDWGDVDAWDRAANDAAVGSGDRIVSAYQLATGDRILIITEADRSATTVMLPAEY